MIVSDRGAFAIACHEGLVPGPYLDSARVWTYGIGHTGAAGDPDPASMPRGMPDDIDAAIDHAMGLFKSDLSRYADAVNRAVNVPVSQSEFDALVSFHYNTGGIARASLTRALNNGDRKGAADGFMGWTKPAIIKPRREAEMRLFRDGVYPDGAVTVWGVKPDGAVIWKPVKRVTWAQWSGGNAPTAPKIGFIDAIIRAIIAAFSRGRT